jgi:hypothetical protein
MKGNEGKLGDNRIIPASPIISISPKSSFPAAPHDLD